VTSAGVPGGSSTGAVPVSDEIVLRFIDDGVAASARLLCEDAPETHATARRTLRRRQP